MGSPRPGGRRHPRRNLQRDRHPVLRRARAAAADGLADAAASRPQRSRRSAGDRLDGDHVRPARPDQHRPWSSGDQRAGAVADGRRDHRLHLLQPAGRPALGLRRRAAAGAAAVLRGAGRARPAAAPDPRADPGGAGAPGPTRRGDRGRGARRAGVRGRPGLRQPDGGGEPDTARAASRCPSGSSHRSRSRSSGPRTTARTTRARSRPGCRPVSPSTRPRSSPRRPTRRCRSGWSSCSSPATCSTCCPTRPP